MKIVVVAKLSASFLTTDSLPSTSQWRTSRSKRPSISHFFDHLSQEIDALRAMYQQNRTEFHDNVAEIRKLKAELKEAENECKELNTEIKNMYTMSVTETEAIERDVEGKGFSKDRIRALANENLSRFLELKEMFVAKEKKLKDNTEKLENSDKKLEDNLKNQDDNRTKFEETRRKLKDCAEKSDQFDEMTGKVSTPTTSCNSLPFCCLINVMALILMSRSLT